MSGRRIGVVGLGRVGLMHARNLARSRDVDDVVLIGRDLSRLDRASAQLSAGTAGEDTSTTFRTTDAPFAQVVGSLDGVVVATPTATHPDHAIVAAEAGVPSLVEKPLALDLAALEATARRLDESGTPVMIAFHRRYDPAHLALREKVRNGEVGTVRVITATNHDHGALSPAYIPISGGIWSDLMIHDFDIIPWIAGDRVTRVTAVGSVLDAPVHAEYGDVDTAVALLELSSGAVATVSGTRRNGAGQDVRLEVFGSVGTFAAGVDERTPVTSTELGGRPPASPYDQFIDRFDPAFQAEIRAFLAVIDGKDENVTPPAAGVDALRVALAAARSVAAGGAPIDIDDVS